MRGDTHCSPCVRSMTLQDGREMAAEIRIIKRAIINQKKKNVSKTKLQQEKDTLLAEYARLKQVQESPKKKTRASPTSIVNV